MIGAPEDFVALDIETASLRVGFIIELGIAQFSGGVFQGSRTWRFSPESDEQWDSRAIAVHGIQPGDVKGLRSLPDSWDEVSPFLTGTPIAVHNVGFDMRHIGHSVSSRGLDLPVTRCICTMAMSKSLWGEKSLGKLCRLKRVFAGSHHSARDDAIACGKLLIRAMEESNCTTIEALSEHLGVRIRHTSEFTPKDQKAPSTSRADWGHFDDDSNPSADHDVDSDSIAESISSSQGATWLNGFIFSITGTPGEGKKCLCQQINNLGGDCDERGTLRKTSTNVLLVSDKEIEMIICGVKRPTTKIKKALEMKTAGRPIKIVPERNFYAFTETLIRDNPQQADWDSLQEAEGIDTLLEDSESCSAPPMKPASSPEPAQRVSECRCCGMKIIQQGRGRPRVYCSPECKKSSPD